jgi:hypothetical protein
MSGGLPGPRRSLTMRFSEFPRPEPKGRSSPKDAVQRSFDGPLKRPIPSRIWSGWKTKKNYDVDGGGLGRRGLRQSFEHTVAACTVDRATERPMLVEGIVPGHSWATICPKVEVSKSAPGCSGTSRLLTSRGATIHPRRSASGTSAGRRSTRAFHQVKTKTLVVARYAGRSARHARGKPAALRSGWALRPKRDPRNGLGVCR